MVGYNHDLFILPFDHRSSFLKNMFGIEGREPTPEETEKIKNAKKIIYEGFKKAVEQGVPKDSAAILLDEQFGDELLQDAHKNGFTIILTIEKSGTEEFEFQYDGEFAEHIKKYKPTFVKALIHYNPEGDRVLNSRQAKKLATLTDFAHANGYKLLIEPLIPATEQQLSRLNGDAEKYDRDVRPLLTVLMIKELQDAGVNPDVWKLEGMSRPEDYEAAVSQARIDARGEVGIVVLGRAAEDSVVESWLRVGAKVAGVIGFAVGRTIFWEVLTSYEHGKISEDKAALTISRKFVHFYKVFMEARSL